MKRPLIAATALVWLASTSVACTEPPRDEEERVAEARSAISVEEAVTAGCSTSQIEALSLQIIGQGNCIEPGAFSELSPAPNANFGGAVLPFLEEPARDRLAEALSENPGIDMQINSMLRTVAQQYLLYRWYLTNTCGVSLAASPGTSNHETGLAIDIQQYDAWRTILEAKDFAWLGAGDPVHFDYVGPGAVDHRDLGVLAFQELWNLNNPSDIIGEDGIYGPQTEARVQMAPAEGFEMGPTCGPPPGGGDPDLMLTATFDDASDRFSDGPSASVVDLVVDGTYEVTVTVENTGDAPATDVAVEVTATDHLSLVSDGEPQSAITLDFGDVAAGESADATITVQGASYSVTGDEPETLTLTLDEDEVRLEADVYSETQFLFDSARFEGWSGTGNTAVTVSGGALSIPAGGAAVSPELSIGPDTIQSVIVAGASDAAGTLVVFTEDGEEIFNLDWAAGSPVSVGLEGITGAITGLRIDAPSDAQIDSVELTAAASPGGAADDAEGCSCEVSGAPSRDMHLGWLLLGAAAVVRRLSRSV